MSKPTVTARQVREFYNADPKRLARLSDSARKTVEAVEGKFPRGRLAPEVFEDHNKRRKVEYVVGSTTAAAKARTEARAALVEQGLAGKRGPIKGAKAALSTSKA